ncbi:MAG TPA: M1 family metallopeptidase [Vicinamibacterales bacterium]|nr:M1 family metallopeptidase [Vicinamibacterales bacterium]
MRVPLILLAIAACLGLSAREARAQRLPTTALPDHYDLAFDVDLARATFTGTETIHVRVAAPTRRIVLHALELKFETAAIAVAGQRQDASVSFDAAAETATLTVARELLPGPADIHIAFSAPLNAALRGFYLSRANGRNYAVTQFESTDARRAFPCFDEPAFKATFSIALTIDRRDTAISNGRLLSDTPGPGPNRHTLRFAESPKMSTYLVAMAVGDFECLEGASDGIPIRVCATPDKKALGHIALDAAERILAFYDRYYSIKYPFGKLDLVAVPDFAAGAMENTASIFYREIDLLASSSSASVAEVQRVWDVLAHEMAHQWFGDLVTMAWWDDLWLNEGFATWMEKQPLAAMKPEWEMDVDAARDADRAKALDALAATRPIHAPVTSPAAIEASFDVIAYEKGGSVMRMIEGYLGREAFRRGVNAYLEAHRYGNATSADFWTAVARASGQPVDRIMPSFVNEPGVPLVDVSLACDAGRAQLTLGQQRFTASTSSSASGTVWQIPLAIKTSTTADAPFQLFDAPSQTLSLAQAGVQRTGDGCPAWAFVNKNAIGYFRTAYTPVLLRAMAPDVESHLTPSERLSLVDDEWALVRAGRHTAADFLSLAAGYRGERSSGVLVQIDEPLRFIGEHLTSDATRERYQRFVRSLLRPLYDELGIAAAATDTDDRRALRAAVIDTLGNVGRDPDVARDAARAIEAARSGGAALDPTAADAVVTVAASRGDAHLFDALSDAAAHASSPGEHYRYLYSLAAFEDPALIQRGLDGVLAPDLRAQDASLYLARFFRNPIARAPAWTFVKQHWDALVPKVMVFGGDRRIVEALGAFCDTGARDDVRAFFTAHPLPATSRVLAQTLERIDACIALRTSQTPVVTTWLAGR